MCCRSVNRWLIALLLGVALPALAAPQAVRSFTADTWRQFAQASARPLAVVFSTTDCAHCPKTIDLLAARLRDARSGARLAVVVMDGAGQEAALRAEAHYRQANALYVFDDDDAPLRHAVNPDWRGLTPYVALISKTGAVRFYAGAPPAEAVHEFLTQ